MSALRPFVAAAVDLLNNKSLSAALKLDAAQPLPAHTSTGKGALCPIRVQPILEDATEQGCQLYDAALIEVGAAAPWGVGRVEAVWSRWQALTDAVVEAAWRGDRAVNDDVRIALAAAIEQLRPVLPAIEATSRPAAPAPQSPKAESGGETATTPPDPPPARLEDRIIAAMRDCEEICGRENIADAIGAVRSLAGLRVAVSQSNGLLRSHGEVWKIRVSQPKGCQLRLLKVKARARRPKGKSNHPRARQR
jgi:hypothetical protein